MGTSLPFSRALVRALVLVVVLTSTGSDSAWADAPRTPAEAFERALARYVGGDAAGANRALDEADAEGLGVAHPAVDVIRAEAGDAAAIGRLIRTGWAVRNGGEWLLLAAAKGLATEHPILATSLATTLVGDTASGRAARRFIVLTLDSIGATKLAGETLGAGFGDPGRRFRGISRRILGKLPLKRDSIYETERAWMWLDAGEHKRAVAIFDRALRRARHTGPTRCWALAGAGRAALHGGRDVSGWDLLLEAFRDCPDLPTAEETEVFIARLAFGRGEHDIMNEALGRIEARGDNGLRRYGLDVFETLMNAKGGLLFLSRRVRDRYSRWPFRDGLTDLAVDLWESYDKRRKHTLAIEMLQPLVDSGYLAHRERARGQLAYYLARSYRRSHKKAMTRATLIHAAYHHPLSWYGILALDDLRTLDPLLATATEGTIPPSPEEERLEPQWGASTALSALRDRLVVLSTYGLLGAVLTEARAAGVVRHPGRAAWVGRLLLDMGAPREASGWAHEALNSRGIHSPLDGLTELWRIAYPRPFRQTVERHAGAHGVDARLAWAVMRIESRYATMARSHAGASGLLQVMPSTARWLASMRMEPTRDIDLYDPTRNIELGVDLLGRLRDRFEGDVPVMLVAYNAGSGRTQRWQRKVRAKSLARWVDRLPIAQAKNYVRSVVSAWALYRYLDGQPTDLATPAPAEGTVAQNR